MVQELLRRFWHGLTDRIDGPLMLITLIIMGFGLATIYSATHDASDRTTAQVMNMLVGIGVMWAVAQIPPQKLVQHLLMHQLLIASCTRQAPCG